MSNLRQRIPDVPDSRGMENALRRARQLADLRWTPVAPMPAIVSAGDEEKRIYKTFFRPWCPQTGANYSAARFDEKYVGSSISFETYMTALSNPNSVLYTRSLHGKALLTSAYYGTVCSQFASYMFDLPFHIDCQQWPFLNGIEQINPEPLENLRLCDILNERTKHTAVITGITRDEDGTVLDITVTDSTLPQVRTKTYLPLEFKNYWLKNNYEVLRYQKLDWVTYTPDPWVRLEGDPEAEPPVPNPVLMPDYGNKSNYLLGETVVISVFDPACGAVVLSGENGEDEVIPVPENRQIELHPGKIGFYQVRAVLATGKSEPVEFCVVDAAASTDNAMYREGETVRVSLSCASDDELLGWVVKTPGFAHVWGYPRDERGVIPGGGTVPPGEYLIIGLYKNAFGVYRTKPSPVFAVQKEA